jgi:tetratricopeptide (TPR) repeat protein
LTLGNHLSKIDDLDGAEKAYRECIKLEPCTSEAHWNLSKCFIQRGDFESAEKVCRTVLEIEASQPKPIYLPIQILHDSKYGDSNCSLGQCLLSKGDITGACEAFEIAYNLESCNAESLIGYADCLQKLKSGPDIEVHRKHLLRKAAQLLKERISRDFSALESREAAEGSKYLSDNRSFLSDRADAHTFLDECYFEIDSIDDDDSGQNDDECDNGDDDIDDDGDAGSGSDGGDDDDDDEDISNDDDDDDDDEGEEDDDDDYFDEDDEDLEFCYPDGDFRAGSDSDSDSDDRKNKRARAAQRVKNLEDAWAPPG